MKNILIILFLISVGCTNTKVKVEKSTEGNQHNTGTEIFVEPIEAFREFIDDGKIHKAKSIIDSLDVNYIDAYGNSFFEQAINKNEELLHYILSNGYHLSDGNKRALFQYTKNDTSLFKTMYLPYIDLNSGVLEKVIRSCDSELLNIILNRGEDFNFSFSLNNEGNTSNYHCSCLLNLCESTSIEMLDRLIDAGMEISVSENQCLLVNTMDEGIPKFATIEFLRELIGRGYLKESKRWSPLVSTCFWNENGAVKFLLENGYNPNWNNSSDMLYFALTRPGDGQGEHISKEQRLTTVDLLMKFGADPKLIVKADFGKGENSMNFVSFAEQWKLENNTDLIKLIDRY